MRHPLSPLRAIPHAALLISLITPRRATWLAGSWRRMCGRIRAEPQLGKLLWAKLGVKRIPRPRRGVLFLFGSRVHARVRARMCAVFHAYFAA